MRNIFDYLHDPDSVIVDDCLELYAELTTRLNGDLDPWLIEVPRLWEWLATNPARAWWVLNNKLQEIRR